MEHDLHHLDSPSSYGDLMRDPTRRPPPMIPDDTGISTPKYETPHEYRRMSQVMLGLITPEQYTGDTDPREWLAYYSDISDANCWDDDMKFKRLISCLKGSPLQWFRNEKMRNPDFNWQSFSDGLVSRYTNECSGFLSQYNVMRRNQGKNESFNSYWESKLSLIEINCPEMPEKEKVTHLFNGLNDELYNKVLNKFMSAKPEKIQALYEIIKKESDSMEFRQARQLGRIDGGIRRPDYNYRNRDQLRRDNQMDRLVKSFETLNQRLAQIEGRGQRQSNYNPPQERRVRFAEDSYQNKGPSNQNPDTIVKPNQSFRPNRQPTGNYQNRPPRDLSTVQCWTCGQTGHYSTSCPTKPETKTEPKNLRRQN